MDINCVDSCFYQKDGKCTLDVVSNALTGSFSQQVVQVGSGGCVYWTGG